MTKAITITKHSSPEAILVQHQWYVFINGFFLFNGHGVDEITATRYFELLNRITDKAKDFEREYIITATSTAEAYSGDLLVDDTTWLMEIGDDSSIHVSPLTAASMINNIIQMLD